MEQFPPDMPGMSFLGVPLRFHGHRLLGNAPYFTLPRKLLTQVVAEVGESRFEADIIELECALSDICGDHSSYIGFWNYQPINFQLLRPKNDLVNDVFVRGMSKFGKSEAEARSTLAIGQQRLRWAHEVCRGYCGWLMTNPAFLDEHNVITQRWTHQISQNGIPHMGAVMADRRSTPDVQIAEGEMRQFLQAFEDFFVRWRLDGMPSPLLPQPMGIHLPVTNLRPVLGHMRQGGTTFYIPDICPVPSRDELRELLEEALRGRNAPRYLEEWFEIVHADNVAKNQIPRFARLFEMQHYVRTIYARHAEALQRKKSAVVLAISQYLQTSDDTVERDLSFIASRLGPDWYLAAA